MSPSIDVSDTGWSITPPAGKPLILNGVQIRKITQTVLFSQFTDGAAAAGTFDLTEPIPVGAIVLQACLTNIVGFTGDTSAAITVGDGSDVDRYNTGTPSVFTSIANGIALGVPSGVQYHAVQKTVVLTVTSNADFTSVSAGSVTIEIYYLT